MGAVLGTSQGTLVWRTAHMEGSLQATTAKTWAAGPQRVPPPRDLAL